MYAAFFVAAVIYSPFLFYPHISWDDPEMVFSNRAVREFNFAQLLSDHFVGNYIPLTMLTHAVAWLIFHANDWGHHLLNVALHLLNGWLVWRLGRRLFPEKVVAAAGALIFLLHPMQVESAGWISELKNVLSTAFTLAGMIHYLRFISMEGRKHYYISFVLFLLGCMSKSSVVVFPLSILCLQFFVEKRLTLRMLTDKVPFIIISLIFGIININTQRADQFINHAHEFPWVERIGFAGFAVWKYIQLYLLPFKLSVIYPYPAHRPGIIAGYIMLAGLTGIIFLLISRKQNTWLAIVLFILCNLVLVLQLLPFGEALFADRYMYVPLIGFAWLTGMVLQRLRISSTALVIVMVFYGVLSFARIRDWKSAISLYEDIIQKYPGQFVALNSAGVEKMFMNEDEKALEYFNMAISAAPRNYKGYYNRGLLFLKNHRPEKAIRSLNEALALYDYPKAVTARAAAYYQLGDLPKAMNDARHAIDTDKHNARAHFVLGNCYNDLNKQNEAIAEYDQSIHIDPYEADFYFKRAIALGKQQRFNDCLIDLTRALQLNPRYYEAYYWRGVANVNLERDPCADFKIAALHNFEPAITAYQKYCR